MEAAKSDYPFLTLWLVQFEKMVRKDGLGPSCELASPDQVVDVDHSEELDRFFVAMEKMLKIVVKKQIEHAAFPRLFPMTNGPSAPRSGI